MASKKRKPARASFDVEERAVLQIILGNYNAISQEKEGWFLSWVIVLIWVASANAPHVLCALGNDLR